MIIDSLSYFVYRWISWPTVECFSVSKIGLRSSYHYLKNKALDIPKIIFRTSYDHYEWLAMFFELIIPDNIYEFDEWSWNTLFEFIYNCVIDVILIYTHSEEEHWQHLRIELQILKDKQSYAKISKCEF